MSKTSLYLAGFIALVATLYMATETLKQQGRDEVRTAVAAESAAAIQAAAARAAQITRENQERADAAERDLATATTELEELRNERVRTGGDFVVFGDDWAGWMRGKRASRTGK
jgi:hypothetical protein